MKSIEIAEKLYFLAGLMAFGGLALSASIILIGAGIWLLLIAATLFVLGAVFHLSSSMSRRISIAVKSTITEGGKPESGMVDSWEVQRLSKEWELGLLLRKKETEVASW